MSEKKITLQLCGERDRLVINDLSGPSKSQKTRNHCFLQKIEIVLERTGIKHTDLDYNEPPGDTGISLRIQISQKKFPNIYRFCTMLPHGMIMIGFLNLIRRSALIIYSDDSRFDMLATEYFRGLDQPEDIAEDKPLPLPEVTEYGDNPEMRDEIESFISKSFEAFGDDSGLI